MTYQKSWIVKPVFDEQWLKNTNKSPPNGTITMGVMIYTLQGTILHNYYEITPKIAQEFEERRRKV